MTGQQKISGARFEQLSPKTPHFHCTSHYLYLALSKACDISDMQCMLDIIKTVGILFKYSTKNQVLLEECIESFNIEAVKNGVKTIHLRNCKLLSDTRRVERYTSISNFCLLFGVTIHGLEIMIQNDYKSRKRDPKSIAETCDILHNI